MSQRTLCWFMTRPFRLTGTIVVTLKGLLKNNRGKVTQAFLSDALEKCCDSWFGKHLSTDAMKVVTNNESQRQKNCLQNIT